MRQTVGFAVFGAFLAVLATALSAGGGSWSGTGYATVQIWTDASAASRPAPYLVATLVGLVLGALFGATARLAGFTMTGPAGNRVVRVVVAGLCAAAVGPVLAVVDVSGVLIPLGTPGLLAVYAACGLGSYVLTLAVVYGVLRAANDDRAGRTVRVLAWLLPIGAAVATAAGVGAAWLLGFTYTAATWIAAVGAAGAVVGLTLAAGRGIALRR